MKKYVINVLILSVFLLGFCAEGMAVSAYGNDHDGPPSREQKEKVRERIETMKMWKLTKALDLDEKSAARLFPLLNEYDKKRHKIERGIRKDIASLKDILKDKNEAGIKKLLGVLEDKHNSLQRLGDEERSRLQDVLTVEQQARYLIFKMEFRREMRKIISEARGKRHKRAGIKGPGGP